MVYRLKKKGPTNLLMPLLIMFYTESENTESEKCVLYLKEGGQFG